LVRAISNTKGNQNIILVGKGNFKIRRAIETILFRP
jgi:hypothetical protein